MPLATCTQAQALCATCGQAGTSCCRSAPEQARLNVPLALVEWRLLRPYASLAVQNPQKLADDSPPGHHLLLEQGDALSCAEPNAEDFFIALTKLFPGQKQTVAALFPPMGKHLRLRTQTDGACVFLKSTGCVLPKHIRPVYCRLFPLWVLGSEITMFLPTACGVTQQAGTPTAAMRLMGTSHGEVRALFKQLQHNWGLA